MGEVGKAIGNVLTGGALGAIESAVSTVSSLVSGDIGGALGGITSVFGDALEGMTGGIEDLVGGAIGGAGDFLNPLGFFGDALGGIGDLVGGLLPGPLGDIGKAITDPVFNFAGGIADFAGNVLDGGLFESIKDVVPIGVTGPQPTGTEKLLDAFGKNAEAMNSIFDKLANLDPNAPDYQQQLFSLQQQLNQLQQANTMVSQIMAKMNEMTDRIIQNMR